MAQTVGRTTTCSSPASGGIEAAAVRHFQERMPYGLFVPDVNAI
jgi:hypothetical protein